MMNNFANQSFNKYYKKTLDEHDNSAQSVGWKNTQAQHIRFKQLLKILVEKKGFSINDVGCGTGHLFDYLKNNSYKDFSYFGYDIIETMTKQAKKRIQNDCCKFITINESSDIKTADFSVASGVYNLKFEKSDSEWLSYVLSELSILYERSKYGFSFNMLTKYSDKEFMKEELYYADPCFIFDFCKTNFSRNVALLHDYNEYDFTILVRK